MTSLLCLLQALLTGACQLPSAELERVLEQGKMRVITTNAASTFYEGPDGPTGLEYDLARGFANYLGVELELLVAGSTGEVLGMLAQGKGNFAAAGLAITRQGKKWLHFTHPYQEIRPQLVYRRGTPRPADIMSLQGFLEVQKSSSHAEHLKSLKKDYEDLDWSENDMGTEDLLAAVNDGNIDYTVAGSNEIALHRRFLPQIRVAFDLGEPEPLAWAFPRFRDKSLYESAQVYFSGLKESGELERLHEKYYGHIHSLDYVGTQIYLRHIEKRLPSLYKYLVQASVETGVDWRLLAAIAYQESHWNPDAVSPTGVRGIMMLTRTTAEELGVENRSDPQQSISGGAKYFRTLLDRLPESVEGSDRSLLALAAYNMGYGHLEDIRVITAQLDENPDKWADIKDNLPLLHKRQWHAQTRHGYARGNEALTYVENIRNYYDILVWYTEKKDRKILDPDKSGELPEKDA